jgi:hypothetical protein
MLKTRSVVDSIAIIKLKVKYTLLDESYLAESELTPLEVDGMESIAEQFDWFDLAVKMIGVNLLDLEPDEFEQFRNSLDVELFCDERLNISLN